MLVYNSMHTFWPELVGLKITSSMYLKIATWVAVQESGVSNFIGKDAPEALFGKQKLDILPICWDGLYDGMIQFPPFRSIIQLIWAGSPSVKNFKTIRSGCHTSSKPLKLQMWWSWPMSPSKPSNVLILFTLNCLGHGKVAFFIRGFNGCQKVLNCQLVVSGCILEKNLSHPQNVQFIASFKSLNGMMTYKGRRI